jgi:hypothetical protein
MVAISRLGQPKPLGTVGADAVPSLIPQSYQAPQRAGAATGGGLPIQGLASM